MATSELSAEQQLDLFLARFTPVVEQRARTALDKMRRRLAGANELVFDNYNALAIGFCPTEKATGIVFSIALYPRWVSLFFARGPELDDPLKLLRGSGSQVRHIVLTNDEILDSPPVQALIADGLKHAGMPFDPAHTGRVIIKSIAKRQSPRRPKTS